MDASRVVIRDHQWVEMAPLCLGLKAHPGAPRNVAPTPGSSVLDCTHRIALARSLCPAGDFASKICREAASGKAGGPLPDSVSHSDVARGTKVLALVDALGNLVRFVLMPGNRYDTVVVSPLEQKSVNLTHLALPEAIYFKMLGDRSWFR